MIYGTSTGDLIMRKILAVALTTVMTGGPLFPNIARADGGEFTAGLLGGLFFSAIARPALAPQYYEPGYYEPAPVYVAPPAVYPARTCYWTPGEPFWNGYRWVHPRVQVCD